MSRIAIASLGAAILCSPWSAPLRAEGSVHLERIGGFRTGVFDEGAAEIAAFEPESKRLFVVNGAKQRIDALDLRDPRRPALAFSVDLSRFGAPTSVAARRGLVAVAVEAEPPTGPGRALFFRPDGSHLASVAVGAGPDMLTFTPDGRRVLVANEGEPDDAYGVDPEGSVSVIELFGAGDGLGSLRVRTADFRAFEGAALPAGVRVFGPRANVARDLEPEYVSISPDGATAWVTLQENDALAVVDVAAARVTRLVPLGAKDHARAGSGLDASDADGGAAIRAWPVRGLYQPDAIAAFEVAGEVLLATANEGDPRAYAGYEEEVRVEELDLDPAVFPASEAEALRRRDALGRLHVSRACGDADGDGRHEALCAFGARSLALWSAEGELVFESGDALERITAEAVPRGFNADHVENGVDRRSDDRGPEPEGVAVGRIDGRTYVFLGLERVGGIVVYDVSDPRRPWLVEYVNDRDFGGHPRRDTAGDLGPEGVLFIGADASPTGEPLLAVSNEVSGSVALYRIAPGAR
jgi:hypothetical protein